MVAAAAVAAATAWRIEAKLNAPDTLLLPLPPAAAFELVSVLPPAATAAAAAGAFDAGSAAVAGVAAGVVMMSWCICFAVLSSIGPASCSPAASQRPLAADPAPGMNCTKAARERKCAVSTCKTAQHCEKSGGTVFNQQCLLPANSPWLLTLHQG